MKTIPLIITILCLSMLVGAQTITQNLTISTSDVILSQRDGYLYIDVDDEHSFHKLENPGSPDLPIFTYTFAIPPGDEVTSFNVTPTSLQLISSSCVIFPEQFPLTDPDSVQTFVEPDTAIYLSTNVYPDTLIQYAGMGQMRDYRLFSIEICPFSYLPASNTLSLISDFTITIGHSPSESVMGNLKKRPYNHNDEAFYDIVENMVENKTQMQLPAFYQTTYDKIFNTQESGGHNTFGFAPTDWPSLAGSEVEYVIITSNYKLDGEYMGDVVSIFEDYALWRTKTGIPTKVVVREDIVERYRGADIQECIKLFIADAYEKWGTDYIALAGDVSVIPYRETRALGSKGISVYPDRYYFDCLDISDVESVLVDSESMPDIFLGRIPVESTDEINIYLNKVKKYLKFDENNTIDYTYIDDFLVFMGNLSTGYDYLIDFNTLFNGNKSLYYNGNNHRRYHERIMHLCSTGNCLDAYDGCENYLINNPTKCASDVIRENIIDELSNDGAGIFYHCDHSGPTELGISTSGIDSHESFSPNDILQMDLNNQFCILLSNGCSTSRMHYDDCVTEAWVLSQNGGGPYSYGFLKPAGCSYPKGLFLPILREIYSNENPDSKVLNVSSCICKYAWKFSHYKEGSMFFGDPTLDFISRKPSNIIASINTQTIQTGESEVSLNITSIPHGENVTCCLFKDGDVYCNKVLDVGNHLINVTTNTPGTIEVLLTAPNAMPLSNTIQVVPSQNNTEIVLESVQEKYLIEGSTQTLLLNVKNIGTSTLNNLSAYLSTTSSSDIIQINSSSVQIASIDPDEVQNLTFNLSTGYNLQNNELAEFTMSIVSQNQVNIYDTDFSLPIYSSQIQIEKIEVVTSDPDNIIYNNQPVSLQFTFSNIGERALSDFNLYIEEMVGGPTVIFTDSDTQITTIPAFNNTTTDSSISFQITDNNFTSNEIDHIPLVVHLINSMNPLEEFVYDVDLIRPEAIDELYYFNIYDETGLMWGVPDNSNDGTFFNCYLEEDGELVQLNRFLHPYHNFRIVNVDAGKAFNYHITSASEYGVEGSTQQITVYSPFAVTKGWPLAFDKIELGSYTSGSPKLFDLNSDGYLEIIFTSNDLRKNSSVVVVNGKTQEISSYTCSDGQTSSVPAVVDINNDGYCEIFFSAGNHLKVVTANTENNTIDLKPYTFNGLNAGSLMWRGASVAQGSNRNNIVAMPSKGESINGLSGFSDIVLFDDLGNLQSTTNSDSQYHHDWSMAAVADFNKDNIFSDFIYPLVDDEDNNLNHIKLYNQSSGSSIVYSRKKNFGAPVIIADLDQDINNDDEIIISSSSTSNADIQVINTDGSLLTGWSIPSPYNEKSITTNLYQITPATIGDLKTGNRMIVSSEYKEYSNSNDFDDYLRPYLKIWNADGTEMTSYLPYNNDYFHPYRSTGKLWDKEPLIANIDDDDDKEIILAVRHDDGVLTFPYTSIYAFNIDGSHVPGFPLQTSKPIAGTPVIGDVDGDGELELVALSGYEVYMWDIGGDPKSVEWGSYRHDNYNTGNYGFVEPCFTDNNTITVSSTQTWSDSKRIYSDIRVESGATLTVEGNLGMAAFTRIIVERGAKLIVNGATIKGICNEPWNGIQVWGNSNKNQSAIAANGFPEQGQVELYDATIMDAEKAVFAGYELPAPPDGGQSASDFNGGIIIADSTTFKNNGTALEFNTYSYDSYSSCTECTFTFDDGSNLNGVEFKDFIHLTGYSELEVYGCDFVNYSTDIKGAEELGNGIYCMDSGLDIDGTCLGQYTANGCLDIKPTTFTNLYYAIFATNVTSMRTLSVHHADFTDNITGIYMNNVNYPEIVLNTFDVSDDWADADKTGLYFDYCTGYVVQQNEFLSGTTATKQHGIVVNESGVNENLIYNNTFEKINEAIKTQGINQGTVGKEDIGLEILCNEFMECTQDIRVHADGDALLPPDDYGIKPNQGSSASDVTAPAGNLFSKYSALPYRDIYNDGIYITYHHHNDNSNDRLIPTYKYRVDLDPVTTPPFTMSDACPNKYDPYEIGNQGGSSSTESLKSTISQETISTNVLKTELVTLVDGGDTGEMIYDVESSTPPQSLELRNELLDESPYISNEVMESAIEKEEVLTNTMIYDVMTSNPKTARSRELLDKLDQRQNPMPGYLKNGIENAASDRTERDVLESDLSYHNRNKQDAYNKTIIRYLSQTNDMSYFDSIYSLFNDYRLYERYCNIMMRFGNNDPQYLSELSNIPIEYLLTDDQQEEYESVTEFIDILIEYDSYYTLCLEDTVAIENLAIFAQENSLWVNHRAENILRRAGFSSYVEPYIYDDYQKISQNENSIEYNKDQNYQIRFYPNPANDYIIIDYLSTSEANETLVIISDLNGKFIKSERLGKAPSSNTLNLQNLSPGVYLFSIIEDGKTVNTEKITIIE